MALVRVAAAVILRPDGQVLLAQRPEGKPYAGYWEFPGGKLEPGETARHALVRELREELGLDVRDASPWLVQRYTYPHADVELNFFRVYAWDGEPVGHDGQAFRWQTPGQFDVCPLLPANTLVLRALELPTLYGVARTGPLGFGDPLDDAGQAIGSGPRLLRVPEETDSLADRQARVEAILKFAAPAGIRVLLEGDEASALAWGCAGVHWSSGQLARAARRPSGLLCSASCRDAEDVARAGALGLDFAVLGPVLPASANAVPPHLGWEGFERQIAGTTLPVFAYGGLGRDDLPTAVARGAHGVAL